MLEDVAVVVLERELLSRSVGALEVLPYAHLAVRVHAPTEIDPELVVLPDLARVGLVCILDVLASPPGRLAQHRLPEGEPHAGVGLLAHDVVPLGCQPHRQHVVGEVRRLVPRRRKCYVAADVVLVLEHLHPGEPVREGPHRVQDPAEVDVYLSPPLPEEVRQEYAHLVLCQRVLIGVGELVPDFLRRGLFPVVRQPLVPAVGAGPAGLSPAAGQHVQEDQGAGDLPSAEVTRRRRPPDVRGHGRPGLPYYTRDLQDLLRRYPALGLRIPRGVLCVVFLERLDKVVERFPVLLRV